MPKFINLIGQKFGRLTVVSLHSKNPTKWHCLCDCGNNTISYGGGLKRGSAKSCGCYRRDRTTTHGYCSNPLYRTWCGIVSRCTNPNNTNFSNYGGRGITICNSWLKSFSAFASDMGEKPTKCHSIERIENDKGYSPNNCRWATGKEQQNNRRTNVLITVNGSTRTISQWSRITGINRSTMQNRFDRGWTHKDIIFRKVLN